MQQVLLTLSKPLIVEAVKADTFLTGIVAKAADQNAIASAYHYQAGDDTYQMRMIDRAILSAIEELKTYISDFIDAAGYSASDNNIDSSEIDGVITITLNVSDRFNKAYAQSLARLASRYIEHSAITDWWKPVNEKQAAFYAQFLERTLNAIKRCFNKVAPTEPEVPYTSSLTINIGSALEMEVGEMTTVTYTISEAVIDDIDAVSEDPKIAHIFRTSDGFAIHARRIGRTVIHVFSRHDDTLTQTVNIYVTDHQ